MTEVEQFHGAIVALPNSTTGLAKTTAYYEYF